MFPRIQIRTLGTAGAACASFMMLGLAGCATAEPLDLGSREYKVGIAATAMGSDPGQTLKDVQDRLAAKLPDLRFKEAEHGKVQFFDTADCLLNNNSMLLRARMADDKQPHLTLKVRNADILMADTLPVALKSGETTEFEDDYGIGSDGKPASDYSRSLSFDDAIPTTVSDLTKHVVHLEDTIAAPLISALEGGPLTATLVSASEPVSLASGTKVVIETSLWYRQDDQAPLAGDASFTLDLPADYDTLVAARNTLMQLSDALGPMRGASAEKALAVLPSACRLPGK